ncbi:restriction endonuclease subunit S [Pelotalea chapellei]|uniref:Restriction endonuclease subunit S n=1 Tax=Pelotalea chapellei TaxID=44671 RepID=A0ABS5UCX6_9BACT|nr:restriction endonuclease subunit S [Pelotalea chapellei]
MHSLPNGWHYKNLEDIALINPKTEKPSPDSNVSFLTMSDVSENGAIIGGSVKQMKDVGNGYTIFAEKDVLVAKINPCFQNGKGALAVNLQSGIGFGSTEFHVIRPSDKILPDYLLFVTQTHYFRVTGEANMTGSAGQKRVPADFLRYFSVLLPLIQDQKKIISIIQSWKNCIDLIERLIATKQERRKWLMQQLLTGKKRLPGFDNPWVSVHLGEVFTNRIETNFIDLPLVAITGNGGVVSREDLVRRDTSNEDKSKYLRICPGDIGYNTMRMWQGVCGLSSLEGIVSPAYTIATPTDEVDGEYMSLLFKFSQTVYQFHRHSQGLVDDTLNLKWRHFAEIKVTIPDKSEQKAIAAIFRTADHEINLLKSQLDALREQKKGLMQQLLTGKRRVKVSIT